MALNSNDKLCSIILVKNRSNLTQTHVMALKMPAWVCYGLDTLDMLHRSVWHMRKCYV